MDRTVHGAEGLEAGGLDLLEERQNLLRPVCADHLGRLRQHDDARDVVGHEVMQIARQLEALAAAGLVHRPDPSCLQGAQPAARGSRGDGAEREERALRGCFQYGRGSWSRRSAVDARVPRTVQSTKACRAPAYRATRQTSSRSPVISTRVTTPVAVSSVGGSPKRVPRAELTATAVAATGMIRSLVCREATASAPSTATVMGRAARQ